MSSVKVTILRNGRADVYGMPLVQGSVATVDREYAVNLVSTGFASWLNQADASPFAVTRIPGEVSTYWQSAVPFALFGGDGGANGLSFDGLNGKFTLSAAILTNFWQLVKYPSGGYAYFPSGTSSLPYGGWFFFRMYSDTTGEIFQETYEPGVGQPSIIQSPTQFVGLTAGRITQVVTEITAVSFVLPGGSVGNDGIIRGSCGQRGNSNAGARSLRIKAGSSNINYTTITTTNLDLDFDFLRQNQGVQSYQMGNRTGSGWFGQTQTTIAGDFTAIDFSVDQTITMTLQTDTNTNSMLAVLRNFSVIYG